MTSPHRIRNSAFNIHGRQFERSSVDVSGRIGWVNKIGGSHNVGQRKRMVDKVEESDWVGLEELKI